LQIALRESKFVQVQAFMERHLGRIDLSLSINCPFYGFGEPSHEMPDFPTKSAFMSGADYFVPTAELTIFIGSNIPEYDWAS
jgi:hypothetical protein